MLDTDLTALSVFNNKLLQSDQSSSAPNSRFSGCLVTSERRSHKHGLKSRPIIMVYDFGSSLIQMDSQLRTGHLH